MKWFLTMTSALFLAGCSPATSTMHLTASHPDTQLGHLIAAPFICAEIVMNKAVDTSYYRDMAYVQLNTDGYLNPDVYNDFMMQSIENLGFFKKVVTHEPIIYINARPRPPVRYQNGRWYSQHDPLKIQQLRARYGTHFFIVEASFQQISPDAPFLNKFAFEIKVTDPKDGSMFALFRHEGTALWGLEQNIFNPVLNAFHDWLYLNDQHRGAP